jgi:tetratricopeptide (TPR) repeat protein
MNLSRKNGTEDRNDMTAIDGTGANQLFSAAQVNYQQLEYYAGNTLNRGIELYKNKEYGAAVQAFKSSIALAPAAGYAVEAAKMLAGIYVTMGETEQAIESLRSFVELSPSSDAARVKLGEMYYSEGRYDEALAQYEKAVELSPDAGNRYALGQAYLQTGETGKAEEQFMQVLLMAPDDPAGNLGLGQTYSRAGQYDLAIEQFEAAIEKKNDFHDAWAEMGYTFADMGDIDRALEIYEYLEEKSPQLADLLNRYIYKVDPPKIMFAHATGTFPGSLPLGTAVSSLDESLADAGASKMFTVKFQFDKEMDRTSVETVTNWQIGRASGTGPARYNYGLAIPSTEVQLPGLPDYVSYDPVNFTATVFFTITQNDTADGTLDPGHVQFSFRGTDRFGQRMDAARDQYTGFSGVF